jgi:magnesium-transporting ATPase (P-type)
MEVLAGFLTSRKLHPQSGHEYMTTLEAYSTAGALGDGAGTAGAKLAAPAAHPIEPPIPLKTKQQNIRVSPAIIDAASKHGEALLQNLRTSPGGLTQAEAEERARTNGPNEVAQERKQGWFVRVLKIIRNPLVILLSTLSAISFLRRTHRPQSQVLDYIGIGREDSQCLCNRTIQSSML